MRCGAEEGNVCALCIHRQAKKKLEGFGRVCVTLAVRARARGVEAFNPLNACAEEQRRPPFSRTRFP